MLDFYDLYDFEAYMDGFFDLKSPNFNPKHGFLSSIKSVFCHKNAATFIFDILGPSYTSFDVAPNPNMMDRTLRFG